MYKKRESLDLILAKCRFQKSVGKFKQSLKGLGYKFHHSGFVAYKKAKSVPVIFEALHGFNNEKVKGVAELKTAQIAHFASKFCKGGSVLALIPRSICDLNRNEKARKTLSFKLDRALQKRGAAEYPLIISNLVKSHDKLFDEKSTDDPFLIVSIHGMRNRKTRDVDVGSGRGKLCYKGIATWFAKKMRAGFAECGMEYNVNVDRGFSGGAHPKILRSKQYLGPRLQYLQIEFSRRIRRIHSLKIAYVLGQIAQEFAGRKWIKRKKKTVGERSLSISCSVRFVKFKKETPVNRVYMDRSQRVALGLKRGKFLKMLTGPSKSILLEVHQAKYFQIGENKIVLDKRLQNKLHLLDGDRVTIINYK